MGKNLYIAEKPSVAQEFAKALKENLTRADGYLEGPSSVVTWCVGHLVTMSYPDAYDPALKRWDAATLPFLPKQFIYEVIPGVKKQFDIVSRLLTRTDIDCIYVCTDSGREGEYIYRLVDQMAQVPADKQRRRVWIDSQTEEEILRGIREAKPLSAYNNLSSSAYLRAKEDYLMGINFSRILTIYYGYMVSQFMKAEKRSAISVGRVMTCVLGIVVRREREIRNFQKTPFYRIIGNFALSNSASFVGEWRAVEGSRYFESPLLYKENGFRNRTDAEVCVEMLRQSAGNATIVNIEKKREKKNPPLLFNLAELQNTCSKLFKLSPDETLQIVQDLYEKKLVTYPRTDARVLSSAVAKEITKNLHGLATQSAYLDFTRQIKQHGLYATIAKSRYTDDKQITDHYAIIPTGQGFSVLSSCSEEARAVYDCIVRRFLAIFFPPAEYRKVTIELIVDTEHFFASFKLMESPGYLVVAGADAAKSDDDKQPDDMVAAGQFNLVSALRKGSVMPVAGYEIKDGETSPPKRFNSGSLILAMENAGQLIEDEELRAHIKGSGIGTSATRAEILSKLVKINYLNLNKKTQIVTPAKLGEVVYEVVNASIRSLLNAELTASWEKGLTMVANGDIGEEEYMTKLEAFVSRQTSAVKNLNNRNALSQVFAEVESYYK